MCRDEIQSSKLYSRSIGFHSLSAFYVLVSWLNGGPYSDWLCSCFEVLYTPNSLTTTGEARFEVGRADHIRVGCPGRHFGHFGVRGRFHDCWRPFVFVLTSVGRRQRGGGRSQR